MTLILTSDATEVWSFLPEILADAEANLPARNVARLAPFVTASQLVGDVLTLTVTDTNKLGAGNLMRVDPNVGIIAAAISARVAFSFSRLVVAG